MRQWRSVPSAVSVNSARIARFSLGTAALQHRGRGACSKTLAPGWELWRAMRVPHPRTRRRRSGTRGRPEALRRRREAEQRREAKPLLRGDRQPAVVSEHVLVSAQLVGVSGRAPKTSHHQAVTCADAPRGHRPGRTATAGRRPHPIVEGVQAPNRDPSAIRDTWSHDAADQASCARLFARACCAPVQQVTVYPRARSSAAEQQSASRSATRLRRVRYYEPAGCGRLARLSDRRR